MFIDINTYVGAWPYRSLRYNTLSGLNTLAEKYDITHMVTANIGGFFLKDANEANYALLEEWNAYNGKTVFLPMAIVNPTYPAWEKDARAMIDAGFAGFELAPLYHGYDLGMQMPFDSYYPVQYAAPVMDLAEELDVPVRICASIENFRGRSVHDTYENITGAAYFSLLEKFPNVHVFCTSFSPLAAGRDFAELIKTRDNIYFDTTQVENFHTDLPQRIMNMLSKKQLCFGSLSPFNYMEANLLKLAYTPAFDENAMKTNAARAFKTLRSK